MDLRRYAACLARALPPADAVVGALLLALTVAAAQVAIGHPGPVAGLAAALTATLAALGAVAATWALLRHNGTGQGVPIRAGTAHRQRGDVPTPVDPDRPGRPGRPRAPGGHGCR